jgi:hypothetical protein
MDQRGFSALEERLTRIGACSDPFGTLERRVGFEASRTRLVTGLGYGSGAKGGGPPFDPVSIFEMSSLQMRRNLSDTRAEFTLGDRVSWVRFAGLDLGTATPGKTAIRYFRKKLTDSGALCGVTDMFDGQFWAKGASPMLGPIVELSLVPARQAAHHGG